MKNRINNIKTTLGYNPGGITHIWLMDIKDFIGYRFKSDCLFDKYLVEGIIGNSGFAELQSINETGFTETSADNIFKQTLSTFIYPLTDENIGKIIHLKNNKYLVAFRSTVGQIFCFGGDGGASVTFGQQTGKTGEVEGYNITIEKKSVNPLFLISGEIAPQLAYKYTPVFEDGIFCQMNNGKPTGFEIARYALKTSPEGEPVDKNGKLCSESSKPQAIFLLNGLKKPYGSFEVEGYYNENDKQLNGYPIIRYNPQKCKSANEGFITLSINQIIFEEADTEPVDITLTANRNWELIPPLQEIALCTLRQGGVGEFKITITKTGLKGNANFIFRTTDNQKVILNIINCINAPEWVLKKNDENINSWNQNGFWLNNKTWEN